jgi:hypothetical protein
MVGRVGSCLDTRSAETRFFAEFILRRFIYEGLRMTPFDRLRVRGFFFAVIARPFVEGRGNLILITSVLFIDEILRCAQDDTQVADVFFVILRE